MGQLSKHAYNKIIYDWNNTHKSYPHDKTICHLFEYQVKKTPNNVAVIYEDQQITYQELNQASNQLAYRIRKHYSDNIPKDTLIALFVDRSIEMIVGILGILKAGAAYVPIDPNYPNERILFILENTKAQWVLTQTAYAEQFDQCIILDDLLYSHESTSNVYIDCQSSDLAYVIYTSGSTGTPKGSAITHTSLINICLEQINWFEISEKSHVLQFASISFDAAVSEIFTTLLSGAMLVIIEEAKRLDIEFLLDFIDKHAINVATLPPALLKHADYQDLPMLQTLIVAGEVCDQAVMSLWSKNRCLINAYGLTEATICTTMHKYQQGDLSTTIGKPLSNIKVYVLDEGLSPAPIDVIGELYISGVSLSAGYLNNPSLTADYFMTNPFVTELEKKQGYARLYKTGDLVKWNTDGSLDYVGRYDSQCKLHGFRIDLHEIESVLNQYAGITAAAVVLHESTENNQLIAYYVCKEPNAIQIEDVKFFLAEKLPRHMIPSELIKVENIPVTVNGKIDRQFLFKLKMGKSHKTTEPDNDIQLKLCEIWSKVLKKESINIHDNFIELGGHSLLLYFVIKEIQEHFKLTLTIDEILAHLKLTDLSELILYKMTKTVDEVKQCVIQSSNNTITPLSFAQERVWFIENYEQGSCAYNTPMAFELRASVEIELLKLALQSIVNRHSVLRSFYQQSIQSNKTETSVDETISYSDTQQVQEYLLDVVEEVILSPDLPDKLNTASHVIFDLSTEYPIKVWLYHLNDVGRIILMINIHHIAFDGWSMEIFLRELRHYYNHYTGSPSIDLPALEVQYNDFAGWQRQYVSDGFLNTQIEYWKKTLENHVPLSLPTDYPRNNSFDYQGDDLFFELDEVLSTKLRALSQNKRVTLYTVLLSGFTVLLSKLSGQDDFVIGILTANRHYKKIENLIGFFANSLPLRIKHKSDDSARKLITQINNDLLTAQQHQDVPFSELVKTFQPTVDPSKNPLFQVLFDMHRDVAGDLLHGLAKPIEMSKYYHIAKFDLSCFVDDTQLNIKMRINYATSLYRYNTIREFGTCYQRILEQMVDNETALIKNYSLLNQAEYQRIIYDWNNSYKEYRRDKTIHQIFEEQVKKTPYNIAVVFEDQQLTYNELNEEANQVARYICKQYNNDVKPDTLIPICIDRSLDMIIGILGIIKTGAAYVPIDPNYPQERIDYILQDTQAKLVLDSTLKNKAYRHELKTNLISRSGAKDLAYVIYTSGTTGLPKGVMQSHGNVMRLFTSTNEYFHFDAHDVWTLFHSYVFDFSVWEMWGALFYGGKLVIPSHDDTRMHRCFCNAIHIDQYGTFITHHFPPTC